MIQTAPSFRYDTTSQRLDLSTCDEHFVQNPYPTYAALHAQAGDNGPVVYWQDYGHWVFGGLDVVNALFRDRRLGREVLNRAKTPEHLLDFATVEAHSLLELEPPSHTRLRAAINKAFVPKRIAAMRDELSESAHALLATLNGQPNFDIIKDLAEPFAGKTILQLVGIDPAHTEQLIDWSHAMVVMYQADKSEADEHAANKAAREFAGFVNDSIAVLRRLDLPDNVQPPLLKFLIDETDLSDAELVSTTILLLNAGHEATVHALGHAVHALLHASPADRSAWLSDPEALVEEVLRHRPPLHMFTRTVKEDCTLYGVDCKRGDMIGLHIGMANHDPRSMPNPDLFDPARKPIKQVAFGAGIHFCIGHMLARLEMEIMLPALIQTFPNLVLSEEPRLKDAYHFHGLDTLLVAQENSDQETTA